MERNYRIVLQDRLMTRREAMDYLHVGREGFKPYERVARHEGKENTYWLHDLIAVQEGESGCES